MPSFVNLGAYVGEGTMVDTWATVGSCAQIGKNVHLSGGVGIGGVLEPMQAGPTIIEDNCFIGARSEVVEGCIVREGSVLGMGVFIGKSTKIVDRATGEVTYGEVPPYSVVVAGSHARQADGQWRAGAEPLLRRHRQAGRREDPLQDLASTNCCATEPSEPAGAGSRSWLAVLRLLKGRISRAPFLLGGLLLTVDHGFLCSIAHAGAEEDGQRSESGTRVSASSSSSRSGRRPR